jgi:hypothetical protein
MEERGAVPAGLGGDRERHRERRDRGEAGRSRAPGPLDEPGGEGEEQHEHREGHAERARPLDRRGPPGGRLPRVQHRVRDHGAAVREPPRRARRAGAGPEMRAGARTRRDRRRDRRRRALRQRGIGLEQHRANDPRPVGTVDDGVQVVEQPPLGEHQPGWRRSQGVGQVPLVPARPGDQLAVGGQDEQGVRAPRARFGQGREELLGAAARESPPRTGGGRDRSRRRERPLTGCRDALLQGGDAQRGLAFRDPGPTRGQRCHPVGPHRGRQGADEQHESRDPPQPAAQPPGQQGEHPGRRHARQRHRRLERPHRDEQEEGPSVGYSGDCLHRPGHLVMFAFPARPGGSRGPPSPHAWIDIGWRPERVTTRWIN